jgi:hypothetical protein
MFQVPRFKLRVMAFGDAVRMAGDGEWGEWCKFGFALKPPPCLKTYQFAPKPRSWLFRRIILELFTAVVQSLVRPFKKVRRTSRMEFPAR